MHHVTELWLSPVGFITQEDHCPHLIYDYTRSGLNSAVLREALSEAMQFRRLLPHLLHHILQSDSNLGPVFLSKVELEDTYMRVWDLPEDITRLVLVVLPYPSDTQKIIGVHLYLKMGYIESSPYFCCTSKTISNLANVIQGSCTTALLHHLDTVTESSLAVADNAYAGLYLEALEASLANLCAQFSPASGPASSSM